MPMNRATIFCIRGLRHWEEEGMIDINRSREAEKEEWDSNTE